MNLKNKELKRSISIPQGDINEETRVVSIAFSSEMPVERSFGMEVLDHNPESVDMERMTDSAPLLLDHDWTKQIGVIETASIDGDKVGRVNVRFGKGPLASEIFQDVVDGIRKHVSVGYRINDAKRDESTEDTYRVTNWQPYEVSIVSVPADHSVGVGRELNKIEEPEMDQVKPEVKPEIKAPAESAEQRSASIKTGETAERNRVAEILKIGKETKHEQLALEHVVGQTSPDEFRQIILNEITEKNVEIKQQSPAELGLTQKETQAFSIKRAAIAAANNDWSRAGFEKECTQAIAKQLNRDSRGFFIPFEIMNRASQGTVGTAQDGGYLKGTEHMASAYIDNLRNQSLLMGLGARVMSGLRGDISIPRKIGSSQAYWLGEDDDATESKVTFDQVSLSPKTIAVATSLSRKLQKQSEPVADNILLNDIIETTALEIDVQGFAGDGTGNTPVGILNQTGVLTQAIAGGSGVPTFAELVAFETKMAAANSLVDGVRYLSTPAICGGLKTTPKDSGSGIMLAENGRTNGYSLTQTNQLPTGTFMLGNFADVLIGMWGVLDVRVDTSTNAASDGLILRTFQDIDIAVRHPESFVKQA